MEGKGSETCIIFLLNSHCQNERKTDLEFVSKSLSSFPNNIKIQKEPEKNLVSPQEGTVVPSFKTFNNG